MVAYGRWSLTRIEPQRVSSEERFRHLFFLFFYGREFIVRNFLVTYRRSFMLSLKVPCMRPGGTHERGGDVPQKF